MCVGGGGGRGGDVYKKEVFSVRSGGLQSGVFRLGQGGTTKPCFPLEGAVYKDYFLLLGGGGGATK